MTDLASSRAAGIVTPLIILVLLVLTACSSMTKPPTEASITGLTPSGTVTLTETFVVALGGGSGTLRYRGQSYPFRVIGTVVGPSASLTKIAVAGDVYKLDNVSDFSGAYAQRSGPPGLETSSSGDLWLQNKAGVIMHLKGKQSGVMLSLGRDEIFIRMAN